MALVGLIGMLVSLSGTILILVAVSMSIAYCGICGNLKNILVKTCKCGLGTCGLIAAILFIVSMMQTIVSTSHMLLGVK